MLLLLIIVRRSFTTMEVKLWLLDLIFVFTFFWLLFKNSNGFFRLRRQLAILWFEIWLDLLWIFLLPFQTDLLSVCRCAWVLLDFWWDELAVGNHVPVINSHYFSRDQIWCDFMTFLVNWLLSLLVEFFCRFCQPLFSQQLLLFRHFVLLLLFLVQ